jgi:hypothetical protein
MISSSCANASARLGGSGHLSAPIPTKILCQEKQNSFAANIGIMIHRGIINIFSNWSAAKLKDGIILNRHHNNCIILPANFNFLDSSEELLWKKNSFFGHFAFQPHISSPFSQGAGAKPALE